MHFLSTFSIGEIAIWIVIVAAIVAVVYVALDKFGITIPDWVVKIFWILVVAFVIVMAIRLLRFFISTHQPAPMWIGQPTSADRVRFR